jgi:hypothetical protein
MDVKGHHNLSRSCSAGGGAQAADIPRSLRIT